jgi:2-polyprenyl-3-methyl-5-hydroxy-6-metoxy-1,4-benzoquinol methylase
MSIENSVCPICGSISFSLFLKSRDYFLTGEEFVINQCGKCSLLITSPAPSPELIGKYYQSREYISHDATQVNLVSSLYKAARFFTLRGKFRIVERNSVGQKLLDIGCGTGEFLNYCRYKGYDCQGVEPNPGAREFASKTYSLPVKERFEFGEDEKPEFDCVTLWHVLEHMHDPAETMSRLRSVVKPGGTLVVALPNPGSWDARLYKEFWAAYDLPRHLFHFRPENFIMLAKKYHFKLIRIVPQKLDSFYVSLLSEKYRSKNLKLFRAFFNGFYSNLKASKPSFGHSSLVYILSNKNL